MNTYPVGINQPTDGVPTHLIPSLSLKHEASSLSPPPSSNYNTDIAMTDHVGSAPHLTKANANMNKRIKGKTPARSFARKHVAFQRKVKDGGKGNSDGRRPPEEKLAATLRRQSKLAIRRQMAKNNVGRNPNLTIDVAKANSGAGASAELDLVALYGDVVRSNIIPGAGPGRRERACKARVAEEKAERDRQEAVREATRRSLVKYNLRGVSKRNDGEEFERRKLAQKARKDVGGLASGGAERELKEELVKKFGEMGI